MPARPILRALRCTNARLVAGVGVLVVSTTGVMMASLGRAAARGPEREPTTVGVPPERAAVRLSPAGAIAWREPFPVAFWRRGPCTVGRYAVPCAAGERDIEAKDGAPWFSSTPAGGAWRFAYASMVGRIAARHAVEARLVMAIIASESGGDPAAISPAGAVGLMQLMPGTAGALGVDPRDPEQNVEGAVRYLSSLLATFGSVDLSLVAYNAGPGFATKYRNGGAELRAETRAFLDRVRAQLH